MMIALGALPEVARAHSDHAEATGKSHPPATANRMSSEQWEREFEEWADSLGPTPAVADAANRQDIYPDRW